MGASKNKAATISQLTHLDPDVEAKERRNQAPSGKSDLHQDAGKPEAVDQSEEHREKRSKAHRERTGWP